MVRARLYAICGLAIVLSIVVLALNALLDSEPERRFPNLVFYGEAVGLVAFGISWLNASHVLPVVNRPTEQFSPLSDRNPVEDVTVDHVVAE